MGQELKSGGQRKTQAGALLLRQKILREATVLDLEILKVSSLLPPVSPYTSPYLEILKVSSLLPPVSPYISPYLEILQVCILLHPLSPL